MAGTGGRFGWRGSGGLVLPKPTSLPSLSYASSSGCRDISAGGRCVEDDRNRRRAGVARWLAWHDNIKKKHLEKVAGCWWAVVVEVDDIWWWWLVMEVEHELPPSPHLSGSPLPASSHCGKEALLSPLTSCPPPFSPRATLHRLFCGRLLQAGLHTSLTTFCTCSHLTPPTLPSPLSLFTSLPLSLYLCLAAALLLLAACPLISLIISWHNFPICDDGQDGTGAWLFGMLVALCPVLCMPVVVGGDLSSHSPSLSHPPPSSTGMQDMDRTAHGKSMANKQLCVLGRHALHATLLPHTETLTSPSLPPPGFGWDPGSACLHSWHLQPYFLVAARRTCKPIYVMDYNMGCRQTNNICKDNNKHVYMWQTEPNNICSHQNLPPILHHARAPF